MTEDQGYLGSGRQREYENSLPANQDDVDGATFARTSNPMDPEEVVEFQRAADRIEDVVEYILDHHVPSMGEE